MNTLLRPNIDDLVTAWCRWCVNHNRFIPLADWCNYTHDANTAAIIRAAYAD